MNSRPNNLDWLDPAIICPGFLHPFINALAAEESEFLQFLLSRHHFQTLALPGADMHDSHGFRRALAAGFGLDESSLGDGLEAVPDCIGLFDSGPARRVALIVYDAHHLLDKNVRQALTLLMAWERAAHALQRTPNRTQLHLILLGPAPAYPMVDPVAKGRALRHAGIKVMPEDIAVLQWQNARDFDLGPRHRWTLSHGDWYYLSSGHRAGDGERWHCFEQEDRLVLVRADTSAPVLEGTFARTPSGMQLVGIRYEADDAVRGLSFVAEDPFTAFRQLCQSVGMM